MSAPTTERTCSAQTYWYENGHQRGRFCDQPATMVTEALDGSRNRGCAQHAASAIEAGARLIEPEPQSDPEGEPAACAPGEHWFDRTNDTNEPIGRCNHCQASIEWVESQSEDVATDYRERLLDALDPERIVTRAEAKGFDVRSTTTSTGRTVGVVMSADFARQVAYSLTERIVAVGEDTREGRWLAPFVADLAKVNP